MGRRIKEAHDDGDGTQGREEKKTEEVPNKKKKKPRGIKNGRNVGHYGRRGDTWRPVSLLSYVPDAEIATKQLNQIHIYI